MKKIFRTVVKNYKVLFKNKLSFVFLLFGPIVLMFVIGFFYFNSNAFSISLGVFSPDESEFNLFFLEELKSSQFGVYEFESKEGCVESIKEGMVHACVFLPEGFSISDDVRNSIVLKLDTSRGDIVAVTENLILDQLNQISREIQILNANKLLRVVNESESLVMFNDGVVAEVRGVAVRISRDVDDIKSGLNIDSLFDKKAMGFEELKKNFKGFNSTIRDITKVGISEANKSENALNEGLDLLKGVNSSSSDVLDDVGDKVKEGRSFMNKMEGRLKTIQGSFYLKKLQSDVDKVDRVTEENKKKGQEFVGLVSRSLDSTKNGLDNASVLFAKISDKGGDFLKSVGDLESRNAETLMTPVLVNVENVVANSSVHLVSLFPSLIVGLVFIISLVMSSMFILMERKNRAHFRNFMSKNSAFNFFIGDFFSLFSIVAMQVFCIVFLYFFWFLKLRGIEFLELFGMILPVCAVFVLLGMVIGYLTKHEASNVIFTFLVVLLFLSFSGKLMPLEVLSESVRAVAVLNPLLLSEMMIRKFLLFGVSVESLVFELSLLSGYVGVGFVLNFLFESFSKKRFFYGVFSEGLLNVRNYFVARKNNFVESVVESEIKKKVARGEPVGVESLEEE